MRTETKWQKKIELFLSARTLIPILGPGVITCGDNDELLYPWLVREISRRLDIDPPASSFHHLVCECLRARLPIDEVCVELCDLFESAPPAPGPLMKKLASLAQCRRFFTLGFDPLFERALNEVRGGGKSVTRTWSFSSHSDSGDLPKPGQAETLLGYLFGRLEASASFHLWDADAVEFVWQLQRQLPGLNELGKTLSENNLLFIGTDCSDWLVKFLLRAIRQKPLTEDTKKPLFLAGTSRGLENDSVFFYDSLRRDVSVLPVDPVEFANEFCDQALGMAGPLKRVRIPGVDFPVPVMEPTAPDGSVFISYSHKDSAQAFEIVDRLRAEGCLVWLDDDRLLCGDNFENNLKDAVMRQCDFFISVISEITESRTEAYFHKERAWAAERAASMVTTRKFYFPVVIDDTPSPLKHEPAVFSKIDHERAPEGRLSEKVCKQIADLQRQILTAH